MMPLNTVTNDGRLNNPEKLENSLKQLKSVGSDGIMVDVWWGIVEREGPQKYNWQPYRELVDMCKRVGLQMQVVMAFHKCGTNVGDECFIELPKWIGRDASMFYTDKSGHSDEEYLSLGVDLEPIFPSGDKKSKSRTAVDMYNDFMIDFTKAFRGDIGENATVVTVEVGLGPAGELRYPSYQLQSNLWSFPGVGEFQCYDKYMLKKLQDAASSAGHPEWGKGGPTNAGSYRTSPPDQIPFFGNGNDNWNTVYGKFFLSWYSGELIKHGELVLSSATKIFASLNTNVKVAAKIAGIHWWYFTASHAPELTAGYYNTWYNNGYNDIANMLKKYNVEFQFTALEMLDRDQRDCGCGPQELVGLTRQSAWNAGIRYSGENALPMYENSGAYDQIVSQSFINGRAIDGFTFLRMSDEMFNSHSFQLYANFVGRMHNLN
jgi:beta-amylase